MSFDLILCAFQHGEPVPADREGVQQALVGVRRFLSDPDWHLLDTADGGSVELALEGLDEDDAPFGIDAGVAVRTWTPQVVELIYRVARLGGMVITAPVPGISWILTSRDQAAHLPRGQEPDPGATVYCGSAAKLSDLLAGSFAAWAGYSDPVTQRVSEG